MLEDNYELVEGLTALNNMISAALQTSLPQCKYRNMPLMFHLNRGCF